jgi:hypothetical protein
MAQHDMNIANQGFPAFRSDLNNALSAIQTNHSGTSRPTGAVAGQIWLDTTNSTSPTLKFFDGSDDISLATINYSANTVDWLDSSITITGLSTTATGTVLTLSDSASTSSVNLILDNQKEVRFRETTANGTNYVALKAPASLASDLTFTLPATDGTNGQVLSTNGSGVLSFTTPSSGISWQSSVKTSGFTATAGEGYFCNTTSAGFTVTLPATPTAGQQVALVDYAGTFDTNALIISPNGNKIEGGTSNLVLSGEREGVLLVYIDSTQGWLATSGINEGTDALSPAPYSIDFLVIAGGGSGGAGGTPYTNGNNGSNSSISGAGLSTITSNGGGYGASYGASPNAGGNGGSGGGGGSSSTVGTGNSGAGGSGNTPSTSPSQGNNGGNALYNGGNDYFGGGGGGASAVGANATSGGAGNGGNGTASSITGSSVTRAGGGGGCKYSGSSGSNGTGGSGGGGNAGNPSGVAGTANTGSGGGAGDNNGAGFGGGGAGGYRTSTQTVSAGTVITVTVGDGGAGISASGVSGAGGKGVVILSVPTANYSATTTGSPTVTTSGSNTILQFNGSGSYTA